MSATVVLLSAAEAQRYLGLPAGTVRSWVSRGALRPLACDDYGRPRYEVATLLALREGAS